MNLLKYMGYSATLFDILRNLRNDEKSCDVNLVCKDRSLRAHRFVLSSNSDFLRTLLDGVPIGEISEIILPDINGDILENLITFIYFGDTKLSASKLTDFLDAVNILGIKTSITCIECTNSNAGTNILNNNQIQTTHEHILEEISESILKRELMKVTDSKVPTKVEIKPVEVVNPSIYDVFLCDRSGEFTVTRIEKKFTNKDRTETNKNLSDEAKNVRSHDIKPTKIKINRIKERTNKKSDKLVIVKTRKSKRKNGKNSTEGSPRKILKRKESEILPTTGAGKHHSKQSKCKNKLGTLVPKEIAPVKIGEKRSSKNKDENESYKPAPPEGENPLHNTNVGGSLEDNIPTHIIKLPKRRALGRALGTVDPVSTNDVNISDKTSSIDKDHNLLENIEELQAERKEKLRTATIDVIYNGMSLVKAAQKHSLPKTVVWRGVRRHPLYGKACREEPIIKIVCEKLRNGATLKNISESMNLSIHKVQRLKIKLARDGLLPKSAAPKTRGPVSKAIFNRKVANAVKACLDNGVTQNRAANLFDIPKSTLWRHLRSATKETATSTKNTK